MDFNGIVARKQAAKAMEAIIFPMSFPPKPNSALSHNVSTVVKARGPTQMTS